MLASDLRLTQSEREVPSSRQCSPLSSLQRLVKDARRTILDPVLDPLDFSSDSADEEDELTPHERRKERERAKIRELRMRRIGEGGLTLPINGGQEDGVFIRRDLDDEFIVVVGLRRPLPREPPLLPLLITAGAPVSAEEKDEAEEEEQG